MPVHCTPKNHPNSIQSTVRQRTGGSMTFKGPVRVSSEYQPVGYGWNDIREIYVVLYLIVQYLELCPSAWTHQPHASTFERTQRRSKHSTRRKRQKRFQSNDNGNKKSNVNVSAAHIALATRTRKIFQPLSTPTMRWSRSDTNGDARFWRRESSARINVWGEEPTKNETSALTIAWFNPNGQNSLTIIYLTTNHQEVMENRILQERMSRGIYGIRQTRVTESLRCRTWEYKSW
jgi:hypothetical protein